MLRTAYELCSISFVIAVTTTCYKLVQLIINWNKKTWNKHWEYSVFWEDVEFHTFGSACMSTALAKKILYLSSQVTDNKFSSKRRRLLTFVLNLLIVASHSQTLKKYRKTFSPIPSSSVCNAETSKSVAIAICLTCLTFNG